ncbi:hypothetical protein [Paracoccus kondratievae]|uniref:Uncharacterized protein n=2 Tax=Bacteria TaxID=2 RepID=A0AAD3NZ76_9RHOB|nr:hypothetical protein [Paracoccus kondratievae]GLK65276.1 hypothetical protein GCM10017635_27500 [Paracoccus kondratievae]
MIRLPIEVSNLPPQPTMPSRVIASVSGIQHWWTPHEQEARTDNAGIAYIRPVVGAAKLMSAGSLPVTYSDMVANGRTRRPFSNDQSQQRYFSAAVDCGAGDWTTIVAGFRAAAGISSMHLLGLRFSTGTLIIRPITSNNGATGGGIGWYDLSTETTILSGPRPSSDVPHFLTLAWNRVTGQVKYATDDAAPTASGTTAAVTGETTATLTLGAVPGRGAFPGHVLNAGIIDGDAFTDPLVRQRIAQYRNALYGF